MYIGGFHLPDKNAAALRVVANAKILRDMGYKVIFLNSLVNADAERQKTHQTEYFGFECIEFQRESMIKYLTSDKTIVHYIKKYDADILIAYNHPAIALNKVRKYCQKNNIKCIADVTEWYVPTGNLIYRLVKSFDSEFRMRYVHCKMDGVIAISQYLYNYYKNKTNTIKVPPLVDIEENKWKAPIVKLENGFLNLIYAGNPSAQKERIDIIIDKISRLRIERNLPIKLKIIGLTKEQYNKKYNGSFDEDFIIFSDRISNQDVIKYTKEADWTIVIRDKNKVVEAGFPTKVAESISCGTPVIANKFSNIEEYLNDDVNILIDHIEDLESALIEAYENRGKKVKTTIFDYRKYICIFEKMF